MAKRIYHFEVYCNVEEATLKTWAELAPAVCPHNPAHAIDLSKTKILNVIEDGAIEARIQEEPATAKTGGHYGARTFDFEIPASVGWHEKDFSFPTPRSLLAAQWSESADMKGDEVEFVISPDTAIGDLSTDVAIGIKTFTVPASVTDAVRLGYFIKLSDGTNTDDLGEVVAIDKVGGTITTEKVTTFAFAAATPSTFKMSVKMIPLGRLSGGSTTLQLGEEKIGGSHIHPGQIMRLRYNNKDGAANKVMSIWTKYLY